MRVLLFLVAIGLVVTGGLIHGARSQRWQASEQLISAAARVPKLPMRIGDWQGSTLPTVDSQAAEIVHRRYDNGKRRVTVVLECGRAGRLAGFAPLAFFPEHEIADELDRRTVKVAGADGELVTVLLRPSAENGLPMRVFAAWKQGGGWEAPEDLKWHYRGLTYVYRVYLAYEIPPAELPNETANTELAAEWLGMIERALQEWAP